MKEEFEDWAKGKTLVVTGKAEGGYFNSEAQLLWEAWQRSWNIAIREQRLKDEAEIVALQHKITMARSALDTKLSGERK